jgi:auxin-responsive protein IAA
MIYFVLLFKGRDEQKQQAGAGCGNELALDEKITAASDRKKGFCPPTSHNRPHAQGR